MDESRRTNDEIAYLQCTQCKGVLPRTSIACHGIAFRDRCELATSSHGLIKIWNTVDGTSMQILDTGANFVSDMIFSSDGRLLACVAQKNKTMREQYDAYSTSGDRQDSTTADDQIRPSGKALLVQIWDTATEQCTSISLPDTTIDQGWFFQS